MGTRQTIRRSSEMARVSRFTSSSSSLWMLVVMMFASATTFSHAAWTLTPVASRSVWRETRSQNPLYITAAAAPRRRRRLQKMTPDSDIAAERDDEDWRDFRARLVALERKHFSDVVDTNSCYVYEMGDVIEEGSVILSRHEHDFCYGLKQQYFHKSIMLVLEHEETLMTNGILLNRPTSRIITDEYSNSWNVWYGGPVRGIHDDIDSRQGEQKLAWTCLHSLTNPVAKRLSNRIIKDIQWTTLETAQFLVENGHAVPNNFTVYCGFASWSPGQLQRELQRNNWYMTSVDSQTILQQLLHRENDDSSHDVFGMSTWSKFAMHIGRVTSSSSSMNDDDSKASAERFDDAMLQEWIKAHLLFNETIQEIPEAPPTRPAGTILRASKPFLLYHQEFHKALLLVLEDTLDATIGVLLNLPGPNTTSVENDTVPVRYGGKFGIQGETQKPITYYHNDESLKDAKIGTPVGRFSHSGIWTCTREGVETAIEMGLANLDDFLVVQGACVLKKQNDSIESLLALSKFDVVPREKVFQLWDALLLQEGVTRDSLNEYMETVDSIWALVDRTNNGKDAESMNQDLCALAWKSWVSVFLLHDPTLRGT